MIETGGEKGSRRFVLADDDVLLAEVPVYVE